VEKRAYKRGRTLGGDDGGKNERHISQSNVFIQSIQSIDQKNFVNSVWSPKTNQTDYSERCYATVPRMSCERYFTYTAAISTSPSPDTATWTAGVWCVVIHSRSSLQFWDRPVLSRSSEHSTLPRSYTLTTCRYILRSSRFALDPLSTSDHPALLRLRLFRSTIKMVCKHCNATLFCKDWCPSKKEVNLPRSTLVSLRLHLLIFND
jgi:hypothetical protein